MLCAILAAPFALANGGPQKSRRVATPSSRLQVLRSQFSCTTTARNNSLPQKKGQGQGHRGAARSSQTPWGVPEAETELLGGGEQYRSSW
eukprot:1766315-Pyramimonas_sp.AAC.1